MEILKLLSALIFVIALMGGLAYVLKRLGLAHTMVKKGTGRLQVLEILPLDARRKLALIKRDDTEHLIILGGSSETVIETGIKILDTEKNE